MTKPMRDPQGSLNPRAEASRHFDEASIARGEPPRLVMIMGSVATGKSTLRRRQFPAGYVAVDAAEIFLGLCRGEHLEFPGTLEESMSRVGNLVASRAIGERRHIIVELIGADRAATNGLIEAMVALGYRISIQMLTCDIGEALLRNQARGVDNISCVYAEPFHLRWLLEATRAEARA